MQRKGSPLVVASRGVCRALKRILLRQFASPLIFVLGVAVIASPVIGGVTDAAFIAGVLLLKTIG